MIRYILIACAVFIGLVLLDQVGLWMERQGWIYYRKSKGGSATAGNAMMEFHAMLDPGVRQIEQAEKDLEEDQAGDPLDSDDEDD